MDKKSRKSSTKKPAGKGPPNLEKSEFRPVISNTVPVLPLLRHGRQGDSTSVDPPITTQEGVDHPRGDSPRPEASRLVDPLVGLTVVKTPKNTDLESANVVPGESYEHQSGVKLTARRSHFPSVEKSDLQGATTVRSLNSLLSPDGSDRSMVQFISDLEDQSAEAAQTQARAQEFQSTIVAIARGKPANVDP